MTCPEQCEIEGLVRLRDYTVAARTGGSVDSLGPLLALSLVAAAGGMTGPSVFAAVHDMSDALAESAPPRVTTEFLAGAARGFDRSGDAQSLADIIEIANLHALRRSHDRQLSQVSKKLGL